MNIDYMWIQVHNMLYSTAAVLTEYSSTELWMGNLNNNVNWLNVVSIYVYLCNYGI